MLIGTAQEDLQTQAKGGFGQFHCAMYICPYAVNGSSSENSPFPR